MTRSIVRMLAVLCVAGYSDLGASTQGAAGTLHELNALLAAACYNQPTLTLAPDGTVVRTNGDGTTHVFKLADIGEIVNDVPDAQANIVLRCRDDKPCIAYVANDGAATGTGKITVFTVNLSSQTDERILTLFRNLQTAAGASGR